MSNIKTTFKWGNVYIKQKITNTNLIVGKLKLENWNPNDPAEIYTTLEKRSKEIERIYDGKLDISLIVYPTGLSCIDFFISKRNHTKPKNKLLRNVKIKPELLQLWGNYSKIGFKFTLEGINYNEDKTQGHFLSSNKRLKSIEEKFLILVPKHFSNISKVLSRSDDPHQRAIAAYLLNWHSNKKDAVNLINKAMENDPDHEVHNNALRALVALSQKVDVGKPMFEALYHPSTACINKSLWLISEISKKKKLTISSKHLKRIEELSSVNQPNISDMAQEVLKSIKG